MSPRRRFYPKISNTRACPGGRCIAFEKYDGTNLHWRWDREVGWSAFGTRRDEFDLTESGIAEFTNAHAHLHECVGVFTATLAEETEKTFLEKPNYRPFDELVVFTEFFGPGSFAGLHRSEDPKVLRLFDVWAEGYGFVGPNRFVIDFGGTLMARVVYQGKLTGNFADDVRSGKYEVNEGVVCKGGAGGDDLWMAKIKTNAYMERLKEAFAEQWEQYWE